jgi:hypothetical protein
MSYPAPPPSVPPPSSSVPPPGTAGTPGGAAGTHAGVPEPASATRRPRTLVASLVLVAVLAAGAYVAFGSSSSGVVDPVAAAAIRSSDAPGYRERMTMSMTSSAGIDLTASGSGSFTPAARTGSFTMAMNFPDTPQLVQALGSSTLRMTELLDGTTIYMKLPSALMGQLSTLGKSWVSLDLSKLANVPGASSLLNNPSSDPGEMLEYLRAASDSVVAEGHQVVGGVETTKYQATVDLGRVVDSLPTVEQPEAQQAVSAMEQEGAPTTFPVAVWVAANKLVRRFEMALDMTASGQSMQMVINTDLFDYGPQSPPLPPPQSDVAPLS